MELSKLFLKSFNTVFPFSDFMYILQQDEYSNERFLRWLPNFFFRRNFQVRGKLQYTQRVRYTLTIAILLWLSTSIFLSLFIPIFLFRILILLIVIFLIPFFVLAGNTIATGRYDRIKASIQVSASEKIKAMNNLKIIAISGSFGKTTVKNFVYQLLQYSYKTQMLPGNINNLTGIANWANANLMPDTEVLVMETDAYHIGEIKKTCLFAPPDIAVILNFGDQHMERLRTRDNLIAALSEVFQFSKSDAKLLALETTWNNLSTFDFGERTKIIIVPPAREYQEKPIEIEGLSQSNLINMTFALKIAELLNVPYRFVADSLKKIELPDRRQRETILYGYNAIDDSYNISYTTAQAGILAAHEAAKKQKKKLLVIMAGIPELGPDDQDKNTKIGEFLQTHADHTILLQSILAPDIQKGFTNNTKYTVHPSLKVALQTLKSDYPPEEWFLLLQPELGDLYY